MSDRKIEFLYNGENAKFEKCTVSYITEPDKKFVLTTFNSEDDLHYSNYVELFPVDRFSKSQLDTAYWVANRFVLPTLR